MPALQGFEPCHIRRLAGLGGNRKGPIDVTKEARARFLIPHPAGKLKERLNDIAVDMIPFVCVGQAFHQFERLARSG
jgi:hypothetical protein